MERRHFVRFRAGSRWRHGLLEEDRVVPLAGSPYGRWRAAGRALSLGAVRLGAPCQPSKVVAVGVNFRGHAAEMGHPLPAEPKLFLKPATAVVGPEDPIVYPHMSAHVEFEGELGVVIGKRARHVPAARAMDYVLGLVCFNDVTARDLQRRDGQWTRAKGFDTFAPLGPAVATGLEPAALRLETWLNGVRRQSAPVADLVFDVPHLVHFVSRVMTLLPGDVIATGTPAGVGPMVPGDEVQVRIEGVGTLRNAVVMEEAPGAGPGPAAPSPSEER